MTDDAGEQTLHG